MLKMLEKIDQASDQLKTLRALKTFEHTIQMKERKAICLS